MCQTDSKCVIFLMAHFCIKKSDTSHRTRVKNTTLIMHGQSGRIMIFRTAQISLVYPK